jgi:hypothetical protein
LEHRKKKYFPENEIYDSSCLYNKPDYLQNLADSIKGHLGCYDYDHLLFSYHGIMSVTFAKQTLENHIVKLMDLVVIHRRRHMSFATVISVTKRQSKLSNLGIPERKIQPDISIPPSRRQNGHLTRMFKEQNA